MYISLLFLELYNAFYRYICLLIIWSFNCGVAYQFQGYCNIVLPYYLGQRYRITIHAKFWLGSYPCHIYFIYWYLVEMFPR